MTRRTIENKIEDLEQSIKTENGVTIVPVDEFGEVRSDDSIVEDSSADMLIRISVSDETYATWE